MRLSVQVEDPELGILALGYTNEINEIVIHFEGRTIRARITDGDSDEVKQIRSLLREGKSDKL